MRFPTQLLRRHQKLLSRAGKLAAALCVCLAALWLAAPLLAPDLDARSRRLPSVVWSRPALLDARLPITRDDVRAMLRARGYSESTPPLVEGQFRNEHGSLEIRRRAFTTGDLRVDADSITLGFSDDAHLSSIHDGRGNELARTELDPEILGRLYGAYWHDRMPVTLVDVPDTLITALIETEDRRFWTHHGVDPHGMAAALVADLRMHRAVRGGSTLTQQLVKNLWLGPERSLWRKAKEAVLAIAIERRYSKKKILETYLNEVYLGQRGPVSIHGIGQGSLHYFGKNPKDLSLSECAFLVGLIQSPGRHSPERDFESAMRRRDVVLKILFDRGRIAQDEYDHARAESLGVRPPPRFEQPAPFVTEWVRHSLSDRFSDAELQNEGLEVHTTIDARLQRIANEAIARRLDELEHTYPRLKRPGQPLQAAAVVLTPQSGEILALVGGRDWHESQFDRATQSRRQPGSSFKPVVALAAITDEKKSPRITLATRLDDSPLSVKTAGKIWRPSNFDHKFRGAVTLRDSLRLSLNVPMVRVAQAVGPARVVEIARRLGIESPLEPVAPIALGSSGVTPLELTAAYAVFASEGMYARPTAINAVRTAADRDSRLLRFHARDADLRFAPAETWLITSALKDAAMHTAMGRELADGGFTGDLAGKSGTTDAGRDLWFVGYTPDLVVGVWIGYDDSHPTDLTSSVAAPIVGDILLAALGSHYDRTFTIPPGVIAVPIHRATGQRAGFGCSRETEWFLAGTEPTERCTLADALREMF